MLERSESGAAGTQWLPLLILALWVVLVLILGLFLLTGRATASSLLHPVAASSPAGRELIDHHPVD